MKLINQSHQIISEPDPYKLIELCGRTCYKSEDKITDESNIKFVKMLKSLRHMSVFEHVYIALTVPNETIRDIRNVQITENMDVLTMPVIDNTYITTSTFYNNIASGNLRAWMEFLQIPGIKVNSGIKAIAHYLYTVFPDLFPDVQYYGRNILPIYKSEMHPNEQVIHTVKTVKFITNRGVTHELVRHRPAAYSQESTRYVKYNNEMEFIRPVWIDKEYLGNYTPTFKGEDTSGHFIESCLLAELEYNNLLSNGWQPQQSREVLPNALKTEIVITCTLREWYHIFKLRCSSKAHPQIRSLMQQTLKDFIIMEPTIFEPLQHLLEN